MQNLKHVPQHNHDLTAEEMRELVGDSPFIIEVGCNDGRDTKRFLEVMPFSRVACFDMSPRAIKYFAKTFDLKPPDYEHPRIRFFPVAIADCVKIKTLWEGGGIPDCCHPHEQWMQSDSIKRPTGHLQRSPEIPFREGQDVQCRPLDYYWDEYAQPVDFLWCDAQGSDNEVILGGQRTLMQTRYAKFEWYPEPLYENAADLRGLCSLLPRFELIGIYAENALFRNKEL